MGSDVSELELYVLPLRVYPRRCDPHPLPWGQLGGAGQTLPLTDFLSLCLVSRCWVSLAPALAQPVPGGPLSTQVSGEQGRVPQISQLLRTGGGCRAPNT